MNLLIIEDDPGIGKSLRQYFKESGISSVWKTDADEGVEQARTQQFDVVILDLLLPGRNGLDALRELRSQGCQTPLIILTALGSVEMRIEGLTLGADDYLVKPFAFAELMARIHAVCRRSQDRPSPVLKVGELTLDLATRQITRAGTDISLSPSEFRLIEFLMRHPDELVTCGKMIFEHLWGAKEEGPGYIIDVHINRLRGKLDRHFSHSLIETVRGRGYVLRS